MPERVGVGQRGAGMDGWASGLVGLHAVNVRLQLMLLQATRFLKHQTRASKNRVSFAHRESGGH